MSLFKKLLNLAVGQIKKNPKAVAILVGTVVGGSVGNKVKDLASKIPDQKIY